MKILFLMITTVVALEHLYFLILEMFFWTKPLGMKSFGLSREQAENSKVLAANQGLYNGFLASGLIWGMLSGNKTMLLFILICVSIAGIYGSISTKNIKLFYIQAIPALIALGLTVFN
jgi:putative membrane protein